MVERGEARAAAAAQGSLESRMAQLIAAFELENLHRSPRQIRVYLLDDMILFRLRGVLTPAERDLAESAEGRVLMRQLLLREFDELHDLLAYRIEAALGGQPRVRGITVDLDPRCDERVVICRLEQPLQAEEGSDRR